MIHKLYTLRVTNNTSFSLHAVSESQIGCSIPNRAPVCSESCKRCLPEPDIKQTKQLKNNQFHFTVSFNGLDFIGQPCTSMKLTKRKAALEVLLWLQGESCSSLTKIDHMSMLFKNKRLEKNVPYFSGAK